MKPWSLIEPVREYIHYRGYLSPQTADFISKESMKSPLLKCYHMLCLEEIKFQVALMDDVPESRLIRDNLRRFLRYPLHQLPQEPLRELVHERFGMSAKYGIYGKLPFLVSRHTSHRYK